VTLHEIKIWGAVTAGKNKANFNLTYLHASYNRTDSGCSIGASH